MWTVYNHIEWPRLNHVTLVTPAEVRGVDPDEEMI